MANLFFNKQQNQQNKTKYYQIMKYNIGNFIYKRNSTKNQNIYAKVLIHELPRVDSLATRTFIMQMSHNFV